MLRENRTYRTIKGNKRFFIHAKKNTPASNGCNFIGEDLKTGTIVCFDHKGEHPWDTSYNLECDPYTWCGIVDLDKFATKKFVKKRDLEFSFNYYLRMENNDPTTIVCLDKLGFMQSYL